MGNLEQRRNAECLCKIRAQPGESIVGQEDLSLHLSGNIIDLSWVRQTESCSPLRESGVCV